MQRWTPQMLNKYGMFVILHERNFQGEANKKKLNEMILNEKLAWIVCISA